MADVAERETPEQTIERLERVPAEARTKGQTRALASARNAVAESRVRASARVATEGPDTGGSDYSVDAGLVASERLRLDAMSPRERRAEMASRALAVAAATMGGKATTRDALNAAGLAATVSGLKRERKAVPVAYELPAVSMLATAPTCCATCGQSLPVVVRPVTVPSAPTEPASS